MFDAIPDRAQTAFVAGQLYFFARDWPIARYYHKRAADLAPNNILYAMAAGRSHAANNELQKALSMVERALAIDPEHMPAVHQQKRLKQLIESAIDD